MLTRPLGRRSLTRNIMQSALRWSSLASPVERISNAINPNYLWKQMRDVARTAANDLVRKQVVQLDGVIGRLVGRLTFLGYYIVFNS